MTELQKEIFEKIIEAYKANNGEGSQYAITQNEIPLKQQIEPPLFNKQSGIVVKEMLDSGYVKYRYANSKAFGMLTDKGWKFTSFADLQKQEKDQEEKSAMQDELLTKELQKINLDIDDLIGKVSDYSDNKWKSKWSFIISVVTLLIAIAALVVSIIKKS